MTGRILFIVEERESQNSLTFVAFLWIIRIWLPKRTKCLGKKNELNVGLHLYSLDLQLSVDPSYDLFHIQAPI